MCSSSPFEEIGFSGANDTNTVTPVRLAIEEGLLDIRRSKIDSLSNIGTEQD